MMGMLLWIIRIPFKLVLFAIKALLWVIFTPLKMVAVAMLIRVGMFLGLILIVAALIYFAVKC